MSISSISTKHAFRLSKHPLSNLSIYVDNGLIVVNKPPDLVCQLQARNEPRVAARNNLNTLFQKLRKDLLLLSDPYPVHRLDKGTTGSLVFARTPHQARGLSQQFQQRTVEKTYLALVRGGAKSFESSFGEIRAPIAYNDGRGSLDISEEGLPSLTGWEVVASSPVAPLTLLRLRLHTGHKHQLRIHASFCLKTPILGDSLYSANLPSETILNATHLPENRIFLHASEISFYRYRVTGPNKRFRLGVRAPLPMDFLTICQDLKIQVNRADAKGGIFVDGLFVEDGKLPDVGGYWTQ
ncbi:pseudouridine synthase [Collybia nuda]|uniref:Pseudouridine synthase n=1 Tax=Collybia nuda TaxID=64659 RepID=A0A9P6CK36_9AGAR|nr:pseudouridine synthase [Collybia nuda]